MTTTAAGKYGKLQLERGGQYAKPRARRRVEVTGPEFWKLDVDMHAAFAAMAGADGTVPSRGVQEIREKRQWPWRVLARRSREGRDAGVPLRQALGPVHAYEQWLRDLYADCDEQDQAA
jgi:hypothetical protein